MTDEHLGTAKVEIAIAGLVFTAAGDPATVKELTQSFLAVLVTVMEQNVKQTGDALHMALTASASAAQGAH